MKARPTWRETKRRVLEEIAAGKRRCECGKVAVFKNQTQGGICQRCRDIERRQHWMSAPPKAKGAELECYRYQGPTP